MRRLFRLISVVVLFAATGCGDTGDGVDGNDRLVFRFVRWDGLGIEQADSVNESSADIDVVQNCCLMTGGDGGGMISSEFFTQTSANAIFRNDQAADVLVTSYTIHFDDSRSGIGDIVLPLSAVVTGGRCSGDQDRRCGLAIDCRGTETCEFSDVNIGGVLLSDFSLKEHIPLEIYGRAQPLTITFRASDANDKKYTSTARYVATYANFCNCNVGETCVNCGL